MPPAFAQLKTAAKTGCLKYRAKGAKVQKIVVLPLPSSCLRREINFTCAHATGNLSVMLSQEEIQSALKSVKYPGYSRDIVSFGLVKEISAANGAVSVVMQLTSPNPEAAQQIKTESERVLKSLPGVNHVQVEVRQPAAGSAAPTNPFANQNKV